MTFRAHAADHDPVEITMWASRSEIDGRSTDVIEIAINGIGCCSIPRERVSDFVRALQRAAT